MPLENLHNITDAAWALWKIDENETVLLQEVSPYEVIPDYIKNPTKRLEFLAGRVLIKKLLTEKGLDFRGLTKDEFGKPFLRDHAFQVSLSHSYPYVAAVIDRSKSVGIDLEQPKEKLLKIAHRVLNDAERNDAGSDIVKHCIYWCAKETLVKIHGKKDLIFSENLNILPFSIKKRGEIIGSIIVNTIETAIPLQYHVYENFVVVLNQ
jgi:4'-phosphopantetheinyl transferase